jgi:pyruvate dehydrogenase E2 component (dihydrolipoamide acetyltransferase)
MAVPVTVPRLGWSMEEGTFVEWLKRDGDQVRPGDTIFVLESDKAAESIEALDPGILRIAPDGPKPGEIVRVGQVLGYLLAEGERIPEQATPKQDDSRRSVSEANPAGPSLPSIPRSDSQATSPRARRVAHELGIDPADLQGTGRGGRVRERDVRAAHGSPLAPREESGRLAGPDDHHGVPGKLLPHTRIRRLTAARMVAGATQAAPVTLTTRADATELVALRDQLRRAALPDQPPPTYTDLVVKFTALALRQHPLLAAQWHEEGLWLPEAVHIAIAVDTEAGLLAPVVHDADGLTVAQIAARAQALIAEARAGRLTVEQMRGATFTVTNLGMFGVDAFTPIINLPQCAVLGIGRIVREPAVVGDEITPRHMMTPSLTFDHRVVDGAPAARFLDTLRRSIEQPKDVAR